MTASLLQVLKLSRARFHHGFPLSDSFYVEKIKQGKRHRKGLKSEEVK